MTKKKQPTNQQSEHKRKYNGPLSLYPLSLDEALAAALRTPPLKKAKQPKGKAADSEMKA